MRTLRADVTSGLGKRLRRFRACLGLTQQELAKAARVSISTISHIENSKASPSAEAVGRLARALGVSGDWLLFGP